MISYNLKKEYEPLIRCLGQAKLQDADFDVIIKPLNSMSMDQLKLYWVWINKIVKHLMAHTDWKPKTIEEGGQQLHMKLKHLYLGYEPQFDKNIPPQLKSLANKTKREKGEMHNYMVQVDIHAMDNWGVMLEKPEDSEFWKFHLEQNQ